MRLVLDTNIVFSGLLWNGAPSRLINLIIDDNIALFTSAELLSELNDVLMRDKHQHLITKVGATHSGLLMDYSDLCHIVNPAPLPAPIAPDPDDDWVIATALAAQADLIVTGDKPFLGVEAVGSIRIITVGDALALF
jgi:uncharacterized protein